MKDNELTKEEFESKVEQIAAFAGKSLPKNVGFFFMAVPFADGKNEPLPANYTTNIKRAGVIAMLKEFMIECGHEEDWMRKHIGGYHGSSFA